MKPKAVTALVYQTRLLIYCGWRNARPTDGGNFKC